MFTLIYRLIVQRVKEYKTKRSARKESQSKNPTRTRGSAARIWAIGGAVFLASAIAVFFIFRTGLNLPILKVDQNHAQLDIRVDSIDAPPMVLYLMPWPPPLTPVPESDAVSQIVIRNSQFIPGFQLIEAGSTIEIVNEDPILHNTHLSDGHNTVFNVATPLESVTVRKTVTATGILNVRCDLHPNMYGWIFVPPSPHFAILEEPGPILWTEIKPGNYRLIAWQTEQISRHRTLNLLPGKRYAVTHQRNAEPH